jgi:hypothetical protein
MKRLFVAALFLLMALLAGVELLADQDKLSPTGNDQSILPSITPATWTGRK